MTTFTQNYLNNLTQFLNYKTKLYNVDFNNHWLELCKKRRFSFIITFFNEAIAGAYSNYLPIAIAFVLQSKNYNLLIWLVVGFLVLEVFNRYAVQQFLYTKMILEQSMRNSAYRFFLTTDPIHHSTKSSGKVITLIENGCSDFWQVCQIFVSYIMPDIVAYLTIAFVLFGYDYLMGAVSIIFFLVIIALNYYYSVYHRRELHPLIKTQEENSRAIATENLAQNAVIRSSFATIEQIKDSEDNFTAETDIKSIIWFSSQIKTTIMRMFFILMTFFIIYRIFGLLDIGKITLESAIAVVGVYLYSSYRSLSIGDNISLLNEKISSVERAYKFIRSFGQPSYPVVEKGVVGNLTKGRM
jgi:ABC-type multidrug transport system fused ATPase/permease subunit